MKKFLKNLKLDTVKYKNEQYFIFKQLDGNGGSSFIYRNKKYGKIFVKFLISPRNDIELNKFINEINLLGFTNRFSPVKLTPNLLQGLVKHKHSPIYYYITEWIEGKTLKNIIKEREGHFSLDEVVDIVHRCSSKIAYLNPWIAHRDFHPGNIIFLNEEPNWLGDNLKDSKVIITDFGNAIMPMAYSVEGGDGMDFIDVKNNLDRRIEGSFKSLGPEIFSNPFDSYQNNPGKSESWPLGILLYKLTMNQDIIENNTLSYYSGLFHNQNLQSLIDKRIQALNNQIDNKTIPTLLKRMLCVDINKRISTGAIAKVLWKYRFNDLENNALSYIQKTIDDDGNEESDTVVDPY